MKRGTRREARERDRYLSTDFGEAPARLEPLKLDLEFPSPTQSISIRLPRALLDRIRVIADERDVPYHVLIKMWLAERLARAA